MGIRGGQGWVLGGRQGWVRVSESKARPVEKDEDREGGEESVSTP